MSVRIYAVNSINDSLGLQESGIFDALEKQYLRSFIFAIYLVCLCVSTLMIMADSGNNRTTKILTSERAYTHSILRD